MALPLNRFRRSSLTVRLLGIIILPLCGLAILLGIGGALVISKSVETVNDRILAATSRAIADSLSIEDGEISLDLPPATFGMLEDTERDNVYYNVRFGEHVLTGYSDLPNIAPKGLADLQVAYGSARYKGKDIRVIAEGRRLAGLGQPVVVEVAETMSVRRIAEAQMLRYLAVLEAALIAFTILMLPIAVRWGMKPVNKLRADMIARAASDLHPLAEQEVPSEIRPVVSGFNDLLDRFRTLLEDMRRFTADASHQMRTPLSILRTHIAVLRNAEPGSREAEESLDDLDEASERLQHLVVQLLALARADNAARAEVQLSRVDLNLLVEEICGEHVPAAVATDIDLRFEALDEPAMILTDPVLAREIIANLMDNAIRYAGAGAEIRVAIADMGGELLVAIEDNGPGIAPEHRQAVFSRFTRLDATRNKSGSGLGLPIAQSLANAIQAKILLATPASRTGVRAEIYFPTADRLMTAKAD